METTQIEPTRVFFELQAAYDAGFNIVSEQGGTRSGKTYNTIIWIITQAWNNPGLQISIVRNTMPTVKHTVFKDFKRIMHRMGLWDKGEMKSKDMEYHFPNGTIVTFFATEDEEKARGMFAHIAYLNEATEMSEEIYNQIAQRVESKQDDSGYFHRFIILDYNPSYPNDHWISNLNNNPVYDDERYFFKTTYKDNPHLSEEQIRHIEKYKQTNYRMWRIYGLGEQCMAEGLIYPEYKVVPEIPPQLMYRATLGIDWGFTDPFVIVLVAIDHRERKLYAKELCYKRHLSEDQIVQEAKQPLCRGRIAVCDNSEPRTRNRLKEAGLRIRNTKKQTLGRRASIEPGIQAVQSYEFCITEDSRNGLIEADNYTYKKDRNGNWTNEPIDKFNHFMDAVRYVVYTEGHAVGAGWKKGIRVVN